ncbi:MAG: efflux RND transporter periplasmic adaptor subunit [Phenylobacterium sp.]|uniref:efflux RND transporter periplasmic adaptor subunit n=1 Tax=Phenylobacterium sp. TaxID=1871053 RepID=UPI0025D7F75F|nr:efflux RND transporter periplasmic adaptor subunit [Phenylobacterium sp.]MCA3712311.1 efflux RND transporter periplasmic adaptor subunit [Phenylobacterium sp.]MCA3723153.1 efflux RND transporter periplasmic adaptor subunit [Phenylobacterium sp.]MCA3726680.1 efflux RND transporter periplasmic adaptor subunit [Phenylobacterium sp.]MCA6228862.1 efflux RND transporter periplasmic adaptor subunit [Phenylobacterium sp.]MCA6239338.1 efflux RND transporter periplasmic adaptor subunit [Phenylobacter
MLRRHFFLALAVGVVLLMLAVGGLKVLSSGKATQGGAPPGMGRGGPGGPRGEVPQVSLVSPVNRTFTERLELLGVAKGRQSVTLSAATTQLVSRVLFSPGQTVSRGQVLVELKTTEQDAALAQARAREVQARRAYERWRTLGEQGYASAAAVDQYEAAWKSARADVGAAESRLGDRVIRAPFAGVVGLSDIAPGAIINPGAAIVTLDDLSAVRVDFQVPDRFLSAVREGQALTATVDAWPDARFSGRILRLDTRIDERTRALTARSEFASPDGRLKPGMMLRVGVSQGVRTALALPESAVAVQGEGASVFVVVQEGGRMTVQQRPVVAGLRQDGWVEILEGVTTGDRVVADGLNRIQSGQPVRPAGSPPPGGAAPRRAG